MEQTNLISVIIPVHNTATYLKKAVDSVRNQSIKEIEIILVDNASTDDSSSICDEYTQLDSRIKTIHIPTADPSSARNAGLKIATANYIGFIDSDDHISPDMYLILFNNMVKYQADIVMCGTYIKFEDRMELNMPDNGKTHQYTAHEALFLLLTEQLNSSVCNKLFKKTLFDQQKFPEHIFYEDHDTMYKWLNLCKKIIYIETPLYYYYQRKGSISHSADPIKPYHCFLANFHRWEFTYSNPSFTSQEKTIIASKHIQKCISNFKEVFLMVKPSHFKEPIEDMKEKLRSFLPLKKEEIGRKSYNRLRKVVYHWPVFYFFHSLKRKLHL